jgi:hypothetical protein
MSIVIEGGITIEGGIAIGNTQITLVNFIACEDGVSLLLTEAGDNLITEN